MKKFLIILVVLCCSFSISAQNYKTHKVKAGETIEAIAKKYLVTPFDIFALNPDAKEGLQPNMVLIIPNSRVKSQPAGETKELIGYKTHRVKRKETLYSIAKKYKITEDEIKKYNTKLYSENLRKGDKIQIPRFKTIVNKVTPTNTIKKYTVLPKEGKWRVAYKFGITVPELEALNPNMGEVLQPGDELNVPNISDNEEKAVEDNYNYYTVQKSEGYMALNRKLGVTQEELETLNPELKDGGLKLGMVLRVPADVEVPSEVKDVANTDLISKLENLDTKRIALMMPYSLNKIDIDSVENTKKMIRNNGLLSVSLDFHAGVLMAIDSAKRLGISTSLKVFDTRNQGAQIRTILESNDFSNYDAVIGPLYPENIDRVASELKRDKVPVLSPLAKPKNLYENVFQTVPNGDLLERAMINFVKSDSSYINMVIIADSRHQAISDRLKREFPVAKQIRSQKNKEGREAFFIYQTDLENVFKPGRNIVFLETENEGFASNVISMVNGMMMEDIEIILMTTDKNKAFEGKEISNYHLSNLKFHYPSVNKTISVEDRNPFVKRYMRTYNVSPNKYAVRGFDLTLDLLLRLASEKNLYKASSDDVETEYVENKFRYTKKTFGGYCNEAVYIVKYNDLTIVEAKL